MAQPCRIFLARHGQTEWSLSGQHTGRTDIPLTPQGEKEAHLLGKRLQGYSFTQVVTSPLRRAEQTCALAGFKAETDPDLMEWDYGSYEGLTTSAIQEKDPSWNIFLKGAPGGESVATVSQRAKRLLVKLQKENGDLLLFSHGHFLRVLAACWLQLSASEGKLFLLSPCSLSLLAHERTTPVLALWNDTSHLSEA